MHDRRDPEIGAEPALRMTRIERFSCSTSQNTINVTPSASPGRAAASSAAPACSCRGDDGIGDRPDLDWAGLTGSDRVQRLQDRRIGSDLAPIPSALGIGARNREAAGRVAVVGTGGLSHWIPAPSYGAGANEEDIAIV